MSYGEAELLTHARSAIRERLQQLRMSPQPFEDARLIRSPPQMVGRENSYLFPHALKNVKKSLQ
jgi:hypothetical protein